MESLADNLLGLLVVAGWQEQVSSAQETFVTKFGDKLGVIAKLAIQLNKAVGEDITSGDLEAVSIDPDTVFDPEIMDDVYADERPRKRKNRVNGRAIATIDMGLQRIARRLGREGNECETTMVLKPKVVLSSALEDVVNVEEVMKQ
jgi:hypothetical protein